MDRHGILISKSMDLCSKSYVAEVKAGISAGIYDYYMPFRAHWFVYFSQAMIKYGGIAYGVSQTPCIFGALRILRSGSVKQLP